MPIPRRASRRRCRRFCARRSCASRHTRPERRLEARLDCALRQNPLHYLPPPQHRGFVPEHPDARTRTPQHAASRQALHRRPVGGLCSCRSPRCPQRFHRGGHRPHSRRRTGGCRPGRVALRGSRWRAGLRLLLQQRAACLATHPRGIEGARRRDRSHHQRGGRHAAQDGEPHPGRTAAIELRPLRASWLPSSPSRSRSATRASCATR